MSNEIHAAPGAVQTPSASFTRPADTTAYASGDIIANSVTAASVVPLSFPVSIGGARGKVRRAKIAKSGAVLTNATFRLHLYSASPVQQTTGDNAAWSTTQAATYLGSLTLAAAMSKAFSDGAADFAAPDTGSDIVFDINPKLNATIFGLLEARAAYTPASAEVFTVTLEITQF